MYAIGLDIGTSSLKTMVVDDCENIIFESSYSYDFDEPEEGYRQINPEVWYESVLKGLGDIFGHVSRDHLFIIGVTGQMHTTVFLDANGKSVYPAIMWNDLRTVDLVPSLKQELSTYDETKYIARILSPGSPAINTLWLSKNQSAIFKKVSHIMTAYDYIVYRLTGQYSLDYCDASTSSFYDIASKQWSDIMLKKCGISADVLGTVYPSSHIVGSLHTNLCEIFQLKHSPKVIVGTGDNPANAVSLRLMERKQPIISLGTSGVVLIPKQDMDFEGKGKNVLFSSDGQEIMNIVQGTVRSAGGAHKWWIEKALESKNMSLDQEKIDQLGKNSVLFFPHITGDKLIYADLDIRGAFFGLSAGTCRRDMTQAVLEGIGFALREVMENMGLDQWPEQIRINGGGTKSLVWVKILASILHTELEIVSTLASPCYGACLLALEAVQKQTEKEDPKGKVIVPDPEDCRKYEIQYKKYKKIYRALKEIS